VDGQFVSVRERQCGELLDDARLGQRRFAQARERFPHGRARRFYERYGELSRISPSGASTRSSAHSRQGLPDEVSDRRACTAEAGQLVARPLTSPFGARGLRRGDPPTPTSRSCCCATGRSVRPICAGASTTCAPRRARTARRRARRARSGTWIVDEAQDLSPMQLLTVFRAARGRLADDARRRAQATGPGRLPRWQELEPFRPTRRGDDRELKHAYRVPARSWTSPCRARCHRPEMERPSRPAGRRPAAARRGQRPKSCFAWRSARRGARRPPRRESRRARSPRPRRRRHVRRDLSAGADPAQSKGLEFDHVVVVEPP